ncbi:magnesium/cobalt transporter CorA [Aneurinibacillus sp. Ricciae_BoGa-3]|uniref:magnesium/cobalt transporter CorA n=1 Tax=Aneurinibacillus sp. Ricciae_BoGa-3 TaxID=3022697 RepID=UPI0023424E4C|nr:magnesium/cobalt transporter CorA [Aneurinibacillus sp. Ricciae_BoGa-3]WCK54140.1 magnesium/cobalt transporter CorA [Aneurinibacillus sp. Ricciae_BoGa-3]
MLVYKDGAVASVDTRKPDEGEVGFLQLLNPTDEEIQRVVGEMYGCHPLVVEDCVYVNRQRPKLDMYNDHALVVFFSMKENWAARPFAMVIGKNFVITICKKEISTLDRVRKEFVETPEKMRQPGLIVYHLLDRCVDEYMTVVDGVEERLEQMENKLFANPFEKVGQRIFNMKRTLHKLRRLFVEERDVIGMLMHSQFPYIKDETNVYLIDVADHLNRVVDSIDTFRESLSGLIELQVSLKGDRMNEIMKTLTVVSTFFLPLTFIVGLYGMNLKVPEFQWKYGYAYVWGLMITVVLGMAIYFKRKKWF